MRAIERHLYRRNSHFYYRRSFPRSLHNLLPFKEIWIGLNTQDLSVARLCSVKVNCQIEKYLGDLREELSRLSPDESVEASLQLFVSKVHETKHSYGYEPTDKFAHFNDSIRGRVYLFSDLVKDYAQECLSDTHGTKFHKESTYQLFLDLMGDLPVSRVGIREARKFKTLILKIPANAKQVNGIDSFKNVNLDALKGRKQHPKTINNRLAYLITLFNWGIRAGHYHAQNPFSNLLIRGKGSKGTKRVPYKPEELKALFSSPSWKNTESSSMKWVPLIGLYSGMRLNEICQLHIKDIRQEDGVYLFDVNDEGEDKGLKTESSKRKVPIHSELIKAGFLNYLEDIKKNGSVRVFPDIPMSKSSKTYAGVFTKRFWRLLKQTGIKRKGLCFHSFRHTFIDGLRNAGVERSIVMTLTGHQSGKGVHDDYGYGYNLGILKEGINRLSFPEIHG